MSSKVQICNMALTRLNTDRITSLLDTTKQAKDCNVLFDDLADEVFMEGSWTSTIRRAELARLTTTPAFEYDYEFQLPVDPKCIKVLSINETRPGNHAYAIEGDKLLTNLSTVKIKYIARLTDTEDWDFYLKRAFISRLASELAYTLTGDIKKTQLEFERYNLFVLEGLAMDGQQGSSDVLIQSDLTDVR